MYQSCSIYFYIFNIFLSSIDLFIHVAYKYNILEFYLNIGYNSMDMLCVAHKSAIKLYKNVYLCATNFSIRSDPIPMQD